MFWNVCYQSVSRTLLWCSGHLQEIVKAPEICRHFSIKSALSVDWGSVRRCHKTRCDQKYDKYVLIEEYKKVSAKIRIEK